MATQPQADRRTPISLKINVALMLVHLALVAGLGSYVCLDGFRILRGLRAHQVDAQDLASGIIEINDAAAHALLVAAESGSPKALDRFESSRAIFGPTIADLVRQARALSPRDDLCDSIRKNLEISYGPLDQARMSIVAQIRQGDLPAARAAIETDSYRALELSNRQKVRLLSEALDRVVGDQVDELTALAWVGAADMALLVLGLALLWFFAARTYNRYMAERNRVENALRESEERFRAVMENIPVGVYRLKPGRGGGFIAANAAMRAMFGFDTAEEFLKVDVRDLYADEEQRQAFSARLREQGRVVGEELRLKRRDGSVIWGRISANVTRDASGAVLWVDGVDEDITERKAASEALGESERRYRLLAENARDVIWTADLSLRLTYVSPSIEALRGYTVEETLEQGLERILTRESFQAARRLLQDGLRQEARDEARVRVLELELTRKDGSTVWTETQIAFQRDSGGKPIGIQGSLRDISQRKRAEEALRASEELHRGITQTADEGIWILDEQGATTFANLKMAQMLGAGLKDLLGAKVEAYLDEAWRKNWAAGERVRRSGEKTRSDFQFRRPDGTNFWAMVSSTPMFDRAAAYRGSLAMITDITDRKRAEQALRGSEERYRLLAENSRDVIWTMDMGLRLTYVSPSVANLRGYSADEATAHGVAGTVTPESFERIKALLADELARDGQAGVDPARTRTVEMEVYRKGGDTVWTEMNLSFIRDSRGKAIGIQGSTREISERKRAEEALRHSESLYRGIVETADEGVWLVDKDRVTIFVNLRMAEMLGYTVEEMAGRKSSDFMDQEGRMISEANHELRRKGFHTHTDFKFRRKNGSDLWAIVSATPTFDAEGRYAGTIGMITDITDRKRAEEGSRILAAVSSLFLAGKDIDMAINTVLEMCGRFDKADRAYVFSLSQDGREISNTHEWCNDGIEPQIRKAAGQSAHEYSWMLDQLRRGQSVTVPDVDKVPAGYRERLKEREIQSLIAFPIFIEGRFESFCGFDAVKARRDWSPSDVSVLRQTAELIARGVERRRAEAALRNSEALYTSLVENLQQAVFRKDLQGRYTFANSVFCRLLGKRPAEVIGKTSFDLLPSDAASAVDDGDSRVLREGAMIDDQLDYELPNRDRIDLHIVKAPLRDAAGAVLGLQGIAWDVTERRKAEDAMRAAARMEATATLAGGIAHDFNNLMVGIQGNADLLKLELETRPELSRKLTVISASARRGGELAHQLLAFARGAKTRPIPMSLADTVREALQLHQQALGPNVTVECEIAPDVWPLEADPSQMGQIIQNLMINAAEAIAGKPGSISIQLQNLQANKDFVKGRAPLRVGPHLHLSVSDSGCGMSEETLRKVFEPFFTTKFQGRGLGLAAIYGIVRNHDGLIEVRSQIGRGSTFDVYLPAKPSAPPRAQSPPAEPALPRGTETILLIDDEPMILEVAQMMLERLGYRVLIAGDGARALEIAAARQGEEAIQLAILDLQMPVMDGRETLARLLQIQPKIKVIVCTGQSGDTRARSMRDRGAVGYLVKPFRMDALAQEVRSALDAPPPPSA